jgi:hypothetical protein
MTCLAALSVVAASMILSFPTTVLDELEFNI